MLLKTLFVAVCAGTAAVAMPTTESFDNEAIIVEQRAMLEARWATEDAAAAAGVLRGGCSATLETCTALEARGETQLDRRAWTSPNALQFYALRRKDPVPIYGWYSVIRRDSCDEDICGAGVLVPGWSPASTLCGKVFTACRVPGARWHLFINKVGDSGCWPLDDVVNGNANDFPSHKYYGALYDNGNGRVIGQCWTEKNHYMVRNCGPGWPIVLKEAQSGVRCEWQGQSTPV
jgi:hypothetical protein